MNTRPSLSTVLFDLDDTLCAYRRSPSDRRAAAFDRVGVDPYGTPTDFDAVLGDLPTAETDVAFYANWFGAVADRVDADPTLAPDLGRAYAETLDHGDVVFRDGARETVTDLLARDDYHVGLVTNGGRENQTRKLATLDLLDAFDVHVYATPEHGLKPDPYPFERALAELDATADRTLYVGNSLRADVAGASRLGMHTAWYPTERARVPDPDPTPDHTLDTLADLRAVL
ncbi:HAD family hydrolase [Halomarina oriensis]|uniref:HAD-IA family hydrolase n=1 Tax=Halomarina oriensis TaxID=671145 RepID=A0A6B0GP09_9EURY|nr:HAD-IA family hydrolase [Halomarina oriensis]